MLHFLAILSGKYGCFKLRKPWDVAAFPNFETNPNHNSAHYIPPNPNCITIFPTDHPYLAPKIGHSRAASKTLRALRTEKFSRLLGLKCARSCSGLKKTTWGMQLSLLLWLYYKT